MATTDNSPARRKGVNIRSVALPAEHGGWGFLLEPILLGLIVAFSWPGALLALAALGVFLIHQPLKIAVKDGRRRRRPPRAIWAERFALGYGLLLAVPLLTLLIIGPADFIVPLLMGAPFALVQLSYDAGNRSRRLIPEICGALALGTVASAIAILGGWELGAALPLWLLLALRAGPAILYIRGRLRLRREGTANRSSAWGAHIFALVLVVGLAAGQWVPLAAALPFTLLMGRAILGLSRFRRTPPIKAIGFLELGYGLLTALIIGLAYSFS